MNEKLFNNTYDINEIESIEFSPDFCATGIWITLKSDNTPGHYSVAWDELPIEFPKWFKNRVEALELVYDMFADTGDHVNKYGFTFNKTDDFMLKCIKMIEADFKKLFPEYSYLLKEYALDTV